MSTGSDPTYEGFVDFITGMKAGDVRKLVASLEEGIVFMPPADNTISGKSAVKEWFEDYFMYFTILTLEVTSRTAERVGDCVVERIAVNVSLEPKEGGTTIYDDARILNVWRLQADDTWKTWHSMWNSVKPIGAGTNRFLVRFMRRDQ
jgi:ketosteroid isomerase-like protein